MSRNYACQTAIALPGQAMKSAARLTQCLGTHVATAARFLHDTTWTVQRWFTLAGIASGQRWTPKTASSTGSTTQKHEPNNDVLKTDHGRNTTEPTGKFGAFVASSSFRSWVLIFSKF